VSPCGDSVTGGIPADAACVLLFLRLVAGGRCCSLEGKLNHEKKDCPSAVYKNYYVSYYYH